MKQIFALSVITLSILVLFNSTAFAQGNSTSIEQQQNEEVVHMDNALLAVVITAICGIVGPCITSIFKEKNQVKLKKLEIAATEKLSAYKEFARCLALVPRGMDIDESTQQKFYAAAYQVILLSDEEEGMKIKGIIEDVECCRDISWTMRGEQLVRNIHQLKKDLS